MLQALIELRPPVDGDRVAAGCDDGLHHVCAGRFHQMDFSKAF
jgi:hypothetical protein